MSNKRNADGFKIEAVRQLTNRGLKVAKSDQQNVPSNRLVGADGVQEP